METVLLSVLATLAGLFRSRALLQLEILALRRQLAMVTVRDRRRLRLRQRGRSFWTWLYRLSPSCLQTLSVFEADTLARWHRKGFRHYWAWKSGPRRSGRPPVAREVRELIRRMSQENVGRGAPRTHGELRLPGIDIAQAAVAKYMIRSMMGQCVRRFA